MRQDNSKEMPRSNKLEKNICMKKISITFLLAFTAILTLFAAPSTGDLKKSIFTLTTYNADGSVRATGSYGVFISTTGEAVGPWSPFSGATSATVTDISGKTYDVETLIGANELYDVCRFHVNAKSTTPLALASTSAKEGNSVSVYAVDGKKIEPNEMKIVRTEKFMDKYTYYILPATETVYAAGLPFVNTNGQLLGLLQKSVTSDELHATDINFFKDLRISAFSINDPIYQQTGIRLEMPTDKKDALVMLIMANDQRDSAKYVSYIEDFIRLFPNETDGYSARAQLKVNAGDFTGADKDMQTAISKATNKAEAHAEYAKIIYQKMVYNPDTLYKGWTFDKALDETRQAYSLTPDPAYRHREAQIIYSQGDYKTALDIFTQLSQTPLRQNGEIFYEAAQCKTQLQAPKEEVIALLDSAIAACPQPANAIAAPYILARGGVYAEMGDYRKALADYNVYDTLMVGRASADFYYTRYQCEMEAKQFQQALNDLAHAAVISQYNPYYVAELASLELRFNKYEDAIQAANACIVQDPNSADAYIIKGIALVLSDKKAEGLECLQKAKDLGDERAQGYIDKYSK